MGSRIGRIVRLSAVVGAGLSCACGHVSRATPVPMPSSVAGSAPSGGDVAVGNADTGGAGGAGGAEPAPAVCADGSALAKARIWRLTDAQYVNAAQQLFGVSVGPTITDSDPNAGEYTSFSELMLVNDVNAVQYQSAAKDVARQAVASHYESFMPCGNNAACAEQFIRNRIARAFGHRLDETEVARYLVLYRKGATRSPQDGVRLMIEATLQSPSFLYRSELGPPTSGGPHGQVALTSQEIATLLALSFTNALPDDALWEKADTGALADPAVLAAEVERLLKLPATRDNLAEQAGYWLGVQRLRRAEKDTATFPEFTAELKASLYDSARLFVKDLLQTGSVADVVRSNKLFLNESLAGVYGIAGVSGSELRPVSVDLPERGYGVLSQPAILTAFARPGKTDPVHRGLFAFNALICAAGQLTPPPNELAVASTFPADATERELAALRAANPECGTCHSRFDPLGLLSEGYDAIGRYREADANGPIDDTAALSGLGPELDGPTKGLKELTAKLAQGRALSDCAAQNLSAVTLGRTDVAADTSCALQSVKDALAKTGKFADFYRALATSPAFVERDAE